jgi:hypothetical protein
VAGGVEGAGYGALHGAGHDEDIGDAASVGALAGIGGTEAAAAFDEALRTEVLAIQPLRNIPVRSA